MTNFQDYKQLDINYTFSLAQISHEIKNPLTLINSTVQLLSRKYPELSSDQLWLQLIEDIDYLKRLTGSLSDYNNSDRLSMSEVNTYAFLEQIAKSYEPVLAQQSKVLSLKLDDQLPDIVCDPVKIKQAMINLIKNSMEATDAGDFIEIRASSRKSRIIITVSDTGKGMPPDQIDHIFEPFTSYKEDGSGLGLPVTKKIITAHKGLIRVYSKLHLGTKFVIILPTDLFYIPD